MVYVIGFYGVLYRGHYCTARPIAALRAGAAIIEVHPDCAGVFAGPHRLPAESIFIRAALYLRGDRIEHHVGPDAACGMLDGPVGFEADAFPVISLVVVVSPSMETTRVVPRNCDGSRPAFGGRCRPRWSGGILEYVVHHVEHPYGQWQCVGHVESAGACLSAQSRETQLGDCGWPRGGRRLALRENQRG